jgi:23S rRNA pseudouridine1911/1915/1917 synthase
VILTEVVPPALDGERVDRVVALLTGLARAQVSDLVDAGGVTLRGATVRTRSARVVEGDTVAVDVPDPVDAVAVAGGGADVAFQVVHADDQVIVVDKPPGLVVHPGAGNPAGTLAQGIVARFPEVATVGERGARASCTASTGGPRAPRPRRTEARGSLVRAARRRR